MEEIAQQFSEELQELLDRYKNQLSVPRIMNIAQGIFHKTLSIKYHPELHQKAINNYMDKLVQVIGNACIKPGDKPNAFSGPKPICSQGPDGCCTKYKFGWDNCIGCQMYHNENQDILGGEFKCID